jgi:hypothetical protein
MWHGNGGLYVLLMLPVTEVPILDVVAHIDPRLDSYFVIAQF